jgi:hypothetical protein
MVAARPRGSLAGGSTTGSAVVAAAWHSTRSGAQAPSDIESAPSPSLNPIRHDAYRGVQPSSAFAFAFEAPGPSSSATRRPRRSAASPATPGSGGAASRRLLSPVQGSTPRPAPDRRPRRCRRRALVARGPRRSPRPRPRCGSARTHRLRRPRSGAVASERPRPSFRRRLASLLFESGVGGLDGTHSVLGHRHHPHHRRR